MPSPGLGGATGAALGFALGAAAFAGVGGGVGLLLIIGMLVFAGVVVAAAGLLFPLVLPLETTAAGVEVLGAGTDVGAFTGLTGVALTTFCAALTGGAAFLAGDFLTGDCLSGALPTAAFLTGAVLPLGLALPARVFLATGAVLPFGFLAAFAGFGAGRWGVAFALTFTALPALGLLAFLTLAVTFLLVVFLFGLAPVDFFPVFVVAIVGTLLNVRLTVVIAGPCFSSNEPNPDSRTAARYQIPFCSARTAPLRARHRETSRGSAF
jgi:hypothetical protein